MPISRRHRFERYRIFGVLLAVRERRRRRPHERRLVLLSTDKPRRFLHHDRLGRVRFFARYDVLAGEGCLKGMSLPQNPPDYNQQNTTTHQTLSIQPPADKKKSRKLTEIVPKRNKQKDHPDPPHRHTHQPHHRLDDPTRPKLWYKSKHQPGPDEPEQAERGAHPVPFFVGVRSKGDEEDERQALDHDQSDDLHVAVGVAEGDEARFGKRGEEHGEQPEEVERPAVLLIDRRGHWAKGGEGGEHGSSAGGD